MWFFPGATSLLQGATFIYFWFLKNFLRIFNFLFLWLCIKESNYLLFKRGLRLFKGLCLLFLPNVPGAMFIQGGTFILDSRVGKCKNSAHLLCGYLCLLTGLTSKIAMLFKGIPTSLGIYFWTWRRKNTESLSSPFSNSSSNVKWLIDSW